MVHRFDRNCLPGAVVPFLAVPFFFFTLAAGAQVTRMEQRSPQHSAVSARSSQSLLLPTDNGKRPSVMRSPNSTVSAGAVDAHLPFFQPPVMYDTRGGYASLVVSDLNGDGVDDVVVTDPNIFSSAVLVLLGNGDGTFRPPVSYYPGGAQPLRVVVTDLNADGRPDLVVANGFFGPISVLMGNGDGTFKAAAPIGGGTQQFVAVADVDGDGKPDLVVPESGGYDYGVLNVWWGNGDGTFRPSESYSSSGFYPQGVAIADVNGDGRPDLLVANYWASNLREEGSVAVLLGNGDGTFQEPAVYDSGGRGANWVSVIDVNEDVTPDLVVTNCACDIPGDSGGGGPITVLLGNGDGTFQPAVAYTLGSHGGSDFAIADVNGDHAPDLVAASSLGFGGVGVLLGNGDGTFRPGASYGSGVFGVGSVAVADVNRDGRPDLLATICASLGCGVGVLLHNGTAPALTELTSSPNPSIFGQVVMLGATVNSSSSTPTGSVLFLEGSESLGESPLANGASLIPVPTTLATGSHTITAVYEGSLTFASNESKQVNQIVNAATSTISLESSRNPTIVGQSVTYTATVSSQYGGWVTGSVTFLDGSSAISTVPLSTNHASYRTSYASVATHSIVATYSGDANNKGSASAALLEDVRGKMSRTAVTTSGSPSFVGQLVMFTATVTSTYGTIPDGELVTFYDGITVLGSVALARGTAAYTTSSLSARTHYIKVSYQGDAIYAASLGTVKQVVTGYPTSTTLTSSLNPSTYGQTIVFTAVVTKTGPRPPTGMVVFNWPGYTIGSATLNGSGVATLTKWNLNADPYPLTAVYKGDATNAPSTSPVLNQTVLQTTTKATITSSLNPSTVGQTVTFTAKITSPTVTAMGPVTFTLGQTTLGTAQLSGGKATFMTSSLPAGSNVLKVTYLGNSNIAKSSAVVTQVVQQ